MSDLALFVIAGTILFFFWAYGIIAFVRDMKNWVLPWIRVRREKRKSEKREQEREEREQELL